MKQRKTVIFLVATVAFLLGGVAGHYLPQIGSRLISQINTWNDTSKTAWSDEFSVVRIKSSCDSSFQPAYFLASPAGTPKPLITSLHSWSSDYSEKDPLADMARKEGWNYIHPDFRGPNHTAEACLSEKVIADIDDAIQYAVDNGNVDRDNIFVVGASGGGYATLGSYLKTTHQVKAFLSWVPISDLSVWFHQSKNRESKYAQDILECTSGGTSLDQNRARDRSPLFWDIPTKPNGRLEIYAGINDGYTGSVPISHSIQFYNLIVKHYGYADSTVGQTDIVKLLTRGIERNNNPSTIGDREVLYRKDAEPASLVIFDGTHEMLSEYCFDRMKQIAAN